MQLIYFSPLAIRSPRVSDQVFPSGHSLKHGSFRRSIIDYERFARSESSIRIASQAPKSDQVIL
jgi:hypothetical protein